MKLTCDKRGSEALEKMKPICDKLGSERILRL